MRMTTAHTAALILLLATACRKAPLDFLVKEGAVLTESRILPDFDSLFINDIFEITLYQDTSHLASITAGENIIPYITTELSGKTLTLDNTIKGRWARPYSKPKIGLHLASIKYIRILSACDLKSDDSIACSSTNIYSAAELLNIDICLKGRFFDFANSYSGSGSCRFRGKLKEAKLFPGGTTVVDASGLEISSAIIMQNSVADLNIWVTDSITDLRNFRGGKIFIRGNPGIHYHEPKDSVNIFFAGE